MKKITLLVAGILLIGSVAKASELKSTDEKRITRINFDEPLSFTERGIEFFVFPNGDFDFNTRPNDSEGDYFFKSAGRRSSEVSRNNRPLNYGTLIEHDSFGRVRRVGNTFINYDNKDRVSRIGTVYMRYNRFALVQIGGMQILYNKRGDIIDTIGNIKGRRSVAGFTNDYYYGPTSGSNYAYNNDYYYKAQSKKDKIEEEEDKD
jgi:hypothetical protein